MEVMPILQIASPPLAVALWVIYRLIDGHNGANGQVTERLCIARRGETTARLEAIEDKLDITIELIRNGGKG